MQCLTTAAYCSTMPVARGLLMDQKEKVGDQGRRGVRRRVGKEGTRGTHQPAGGAPGGNATRQTVFYPSVTVSTDAAQSTASDKCSQSPPGVAIDG